MEDTFTLRVLSNATLTDRRWQRIQGLINHVRPNWQRGTAVLVKEVIFQGA